MFPVAHISIVSCLLQLVKSIGETEVFNTSDLWTIHKESDCVHFSPNVIQTYFFAVLNHIEHPGSIFFVSDCISEVTQDDLRGLSSTSLAILSTATLIQVSASLFDGSRPFIMLLLPEEMAATAALKIQENYHNLNKRFLKWQPTILTTLWGNELTAPDVQYEILRNAFMNLTLHLDSNFFVTFPGPKKPPSAVKEPQFDFAVWELYNIKSVRMLEIVEMITATNNDIPLFLERCVTRRRNFHLQKLTASVRTTLYDDGWIVVDKKENDTYALVGGFAALFYWDFKQLLNFSEHIILGESMEVLPNGSVGGNVVHQLNSGEADFILNPISFSLYRAQAFSYLHPTYHDFVYAYFKQPSANSMRNMVTVAFTKELWITLIGVWAILTVSTKVRLLFSKKFFTSLMPRLVSSKDYRFSKESGLWSVAAFCQKSWYLDPESAFLRMLLVIGLIMSFISYTVYSGSIVSSLAINRIPVKTFEDLINFNFIFTVHEKSETFKFMLRAIIETYNLRQEVKTVSNVDEIPHLFIGSTGIVPEVQSTKKVFLSHADLFYKTAEFYNYSDIFLCDHITSLHAGTYLTKNGMMVKMGSQFKEVLNFVLLYLRDCGLLDRKTDNYFGTIMLSCISKDDQIIVDPTTLSDVFTIGITLLIGMLIALLGLALEVIYYNYRNNRMIYDNNRKSRREWGYSNYYEYIFDAYRWDFDNQTSHDFRL